MIKTCLCFVLVLCNKLNEVLNLLCMRYGKLIGSTQCDATSADNMQYWYAGKANWNRSDNIPLRAYYSL